MNVSGQDNLGKTSAFGESESCWVFGGVVWSLQTEGVLTASLRRRASTGAVIQSLFATANEN
jgi:hypothetical protein